MRLYKILLLLLTSILVLSGCNGGSESSISSKDDSSESLSSSLENESSNENESSDESDASQEPETSIEVIGEFINETTVNVNTYQNPLLTPETENAWEFYGFGDPFVMRYNGKYYLYSSTLDWYSQIKVWTSDNLVDWEYAGICAESDVLFAAYAPEVTYYNGSFYMYTSPNGGGHYVLKSDSPLGPFKVMTENQQCSIDGHIFIDDNGKWYFYYAGERGIRVKEIKDPLNLQTSEINTGIDVSGGWTEGAMVIKRNGVYYLTYCGNHVWSKGYRIEGATSTTNPTEFTKISENILMVNTDDRVYGIGHSSTVLGPDMDTYFVVYHNFTSVPQRSMNIVPLCLNGTDFSVLGIPTTAQHAPTLPAIYTDSKSQNDAFEYVDFTFENGTLTINKGGMQITKDVINSDTYTAEVNFLSIENKAGVVFAYQDAENYCSAIINAKSQQLFVYSYENGEKTDTKSFSLPKSFSKNFNFNVLQSLSVKKDGNTYSFYFNGLHLGDFEASKAAGKFGIISQEGKATLGYVAISHKANGNGLKDYYKPIEGTLTAITSVENGATVTKDNVQYVVMKENYIRNYFVNVATEGTYDIRTTYFSQADTVIEIYKGGNVIGTISLPATGDEVSSVTTRFVNLNQGFGVISFKVKSGNANVLSYKFMQSEEFTPSEDGKIDLTKPYYGDGSWEISSDKLILTPTEEQPKVHGKLFYGNEGWGDYSVEATFTFTSYGREVGMVLRASEPAMGGAGNDSILGKYFYKGYFICFDRTKGVLICKIDYEKEAVLASFPLDVINNETVTLKSEISGNTIKVYANGTLLGEYTDNYSPFTNGAVAFAGLGATATIENVKIN